MTDLDPRRESLYRLRLSIERFSATSGYQLRLATERLTESLQVVTAELKRGAERALAQMRANREAYEQQHHEREAAYQAWKKDQIAPPAPTSTSEAS